MSIERLKSDTTMNKKIDACCLFFNSANELTPNPHCHDFFEIMLVSSGQIIHNINSKKELLLDGSLIFIRPDDVHYFEKSGEHNCQLINMAFPIDVLNRLSVFLGEGFPVEKILSAPFPIHIVLSSIEKNILKNNIERINLLPAGESAIIKMQLRALLTYILTNYIVTPSIINQNNIPNWLVELCSEISKKENFVKGISSIEKISDKSYEYICRTFRKYFNCTPVEYINDLRLNYAANLLTNSNYSLIDISMSVGFESHSYFYSLFKKKFADTPANYRNKNQKSLSMISI